MSRPPRVSLATPELADVDDYIDAVRASRAFHAPFSTPADTTDAFENYVARCQSESFEGLLVRSVADHSLVGVFNLSQIFRRSFQNAYLGYWANVVHQGQGLMSEALPLVLGRAFDELGLHRLEANIQPANEASIRLVRRAGFRKEGYSPRYLHIDGEWRDHERWAITAEDRA